MKIAIVTETFLPSTDGIVTRLCESVRWLKAQGHQILIIAPDLGVSEYNGIPVKGIPAHRLFFYRTKKFALPHPLVKKYLESFQPDIVHVVNPALLGLAGIFFAKRLGLSLIASYHTNVARYMDYYHLSLFKPLIWRYFRAMHNQAEINLCTSQTVREELEERKFRNVRLWKRGVDLQRFRPEMKSAAMRSRLTDGHPDKTLLLYVGRLAAEKEIEKVREILEASPGLWLALVGDGPYRKELEAYFSHSNVTFTGFLHDQALAEAYASSDLFVFPSTTETLGLVILEAMASGLPVVAADSGPSREQIENGKSGVLYDPERPGDFLQKVLSIVNDAEYLETMKITARQESIHLGWNKASEQLLGFYKQVVDRVPLHTNKRKII
ncbi:glycosyltransferase family 4 protein [Sporolactobacillus sp. KGMB 08714]|uniref:glycosyltransferase family 4 protein n=1 Tax=Sporolactobacillus sp. KGMB 08714 TaxID=3064704 RepID=UPI002FBECC02